MQNQNVNHLYGGIPIGVINVQGKLEGPGVTLITPNEGLTFQGKKEGPETIYINKEYDESPTPAMLAALKDKYVRPKRK